MATKEIIETFFRDELPHVSIIIEQVGNRTSIIRKRIGTKDLRPGNTVSGPILMGMADAALYVAILGELGLVVQTVTTSLNVNFLKKPSSDRDIIAKCRLIKVGKSLVTGDVFLYSEGVQDPVAHAVGTYSLPKTTQTM